MIFDHESGNWKNSEVVSGMLNIIALKDGAVGEPVVNDDDGNLDLQPAPPSDGPTLIEVKAALDRVEMDISNNSHLIISELNKIASECQDNQKAALAIEMAIEDIKNLY